ncbi:linoleate 13S-lipoxygenase 2-1 chloroplastic-like, partial [Trifolium medium]|nr:linoleate 13S-lipoxygenase 2-1 chloroplastic-like [Trifolium medium]
MDCVAQFVKAVLTCGSGNNDTNTKSHNNLIKVKAIVTLKHSDDGLLPNLVDDGIQKIEELVGKTLVLELVSNELDQ